MSNNKPSQAKPSQAKPSQAKPSQAKPSQAKPSQAKPIQFKLFGAILTKMELFWSSTYFFMFFQISLSIFT
jgi:hypothetical protein